MSEWFEINGFHSTTQKNAEKIKNNGFLPSEKNNEWLGKGVYFWCQYNDALFWVSNSHKKVNEMCIISVDILEKNEYVLDLDIYDNMKKLEEFVINFNHENYEKGQTFDFNSAEQLRCFYCEMYKIYYKVNIISYSFTIKGNNCCGFPQTRRQFCVSNTDCITITNYESIKKDDIDVI